MNNTVTMKNVRLPIFITNLRFIFLSKKGGTITILMDEQPKYIQCDQDWKTKRVYCSYAWPRDSAIRESLEKISKRCPYGKVGDHPNIWIPDKKGFYEKISTEPLIISSVKIVQNDKKQFGWKIEIKPI